MTSADKPRFSVLTAGAAVFLPSLLFEVGVGAIMPVIALSTRDLGGTLAAAGLVVALLGVGQILGDVPAGALAGRLGDRRAMLTASCIGALGFLGCALAPSVLTLGMAVLVVGFAGAVFALARQSYLIDITPPMYVARSLSTLGGSHRAGLFLGPFIGAGVIHLFGLSGVYWFALALTVVVVAVVMLAAEPPPARPRPVGRQGPRPTMRALLREHRGVLTTLGPVVLMIGAVRGARLTALPLWTEHLGLSPAVTSMVFGISGALDLAVFYPAGYVMDRFGRLWVGVPSLLLLALSLVLLPLTGGAGSAVAVASLLGLANGLGSGLLMTMGADVAPPDDRPRFLGVWRLLQDTGNAAGPLVVSAGAALGSLAAGIIAMGGVGVVAAAAMQGLMPRWTEHANQTTRRRAAQRRAAEAAAAEGTGEQGPAAEPPDDDDKDDGGPAALAGDR